MEFHWTKKTSATNFRLYSLKKEEEEEKKIEEKQKKGEYQSLHYIISWIFSFLSFVGVDFRTCLITRIFYGLGSFGFFFGIFGIAHSLKTSVCELPKLQKTYSRKIPKKRVQSVWIKKGQRTGLIFRIRFFVIIRCGWTEILEFRLLWRGINNFIRFGINSKFSLNEPKAKFYC